MHVVMVKCEEWESKTCERRQQRVYSAAPPVARAAEWRHENWTGHKNILARTVDELRAVMHDLLDLALFCEMTDGNACERAVDFEALNEDGLADEAESGDLLEDAVVCRLVKGDGVLGLVLDLSLGPLLLLCCLPP